MYLETVVLTFQGQHPTVLCLIEETLGSVLLCVCLVLYTAFTQLVTAAPAHLSLLPNGVGDMEQVTSGIVLLLLLLAEQMLMLYSTGY